MYCRFCKKDCDYFICNKISSFPEILTIILNRGQHLEFDVEFEINYNLDNIEKYIIKIDGNINETKNQRYELIAMIIHFGNSGIDGHFYTYCKSPVDRKWYWYNDATVKYVSNPIESIRGIPYLLFYQKMQN